MVTLQCGMIVTSDICCVFIKITLLELEPHFFHFQIFLHPFCASGTEIQLAKMLLGCSLPALLVNFRLKRT